MIRHECTGTGIHPVHFYPAQLPPPELNEAPCTRRQLELARQAVSAPYRRATEQSRQARAALREARTARRTATTPLRWLSALGDMLAAQFDLALAKRWQTHVAQGIPPALLERQLGQPADELPACPHEPRPVSWPRASLAFLAIAALGSTPLRTEWLVPTPEQKLAMIQSGSFCITMAGNGAPAPMPGKAPCCNPREQLEPRRRDSRDRSTAPV